MASEFESIKGLATNFNQKYGVNFSYEEFESDVRRFKNLQVNFANMEGSIFDRTYTGNFSKLFRAAFINFIDKNIPAFDTEQFYQDYLNMMNGYKRVKDNKADKDRSSERVPQWPDKATIFKHVQQDLSDPKKEIPNSKVDYIIKRYNEGKLPLRKMRAHAAELIKNGADDRETLSVIMAYSIAISQVNQARPKWQKRLFFVRSNAEIRDSAAIKQMLRQHIAKLQKNDYNGRKASEYNFTLIGQAASNTDMIAGIKQDVAKQAEGVKVDNSPETLEAEFVNNVTKAVMKGNSTAKQKSQTIYNKMYSQLGGYKKLEGFVVDAVEKSNSPLSHPYPSIYAHKIGSKLSEMAIQMSERYDQITRNADNSPKDYTHEEVHGMMKEEVLKMFTVAFKGLDEAGLNIKDRLVAAQRMTDEIVSTCTPAAFTPYNFGKYGNNYVLNECAEELKNIVQENLLSTDPEYNIIGGYDDNIAQAKEEVGDSLSDRLKETFEAEHAAAIKASKDTQPPKLGGHYMDEIYPEKQNQPKNLI